MLATTSGTVEVVGDWLELRFTHDPSLVQALHGLGARRLGTGWWRVPAVHGHHLVLKTERFGLRWLGEAAEVHRRALEREAELAHQDSLARQAKSGGLPFGPWRSDVALLAHQRVAVDFLTARVFGLLCDEQGLGKTLSALAAFVRLRERHEADVLLVVCPNSLKYSWRDEAMRFFPALTVSVARGYKPTRRRAYKATADIYVTNYEAARSDYAELRLLLRRARTVLVCDESHAAKNPSSRIVNSLMFIQSAAERIWMMSGTPVTNRLEDCYAQVAIADGGRTFGTRERFWQRFVDRQDRGAAIGDLKAVLDPMLLRRTKEEALDLPDKVFEVRQVELRGEQLHLYRAFRDNLYKDVKAMTPEQFKAASGTMLVRLLRLSQIASNPRLVAPDFVGDNAKTVEIDGLLEEVIEANGRKVVLWSHYVKTIEEFIARYAKYRPVAIYGAVPIEGRREAVTRFQGDPETMLFIGNPQAAGTGLTLTAAHYAIYETLTWRYDLYAQSIDRTHRIGQVRNVTYFNVLAHETIDEDIAESLDAKRVLAAEVLGDADREPRFTRERVLDMLAAQRRD